MFAVASYPALEDPRHIVPAYLDDEDEYCDQYVGNHAHQYYCLVCGFEFKAVDAENCPACGGDVQKEW